MPTLNELQQAFAASMLHESDTSICTFIEGGGFSAAERLDLYRNTFRSVLTEALRMTYPAVERIVGNEFFDAAAQAYIAAHPPASAYLNEYGAGFAGWLGEFPPAGGLDYLPDVARFEWVLNLAANAADEPVLEPAALLAVDPQEHGSLCFEPHPSLSLLCLRYPADQIADAVMSGDHAAMAQIDLSSGPIWLVVHRGPAGVESQRLAQGSYRFVSGICTGDALASLLQAAPAQAPELLAEQLVKGRLTAFRVGPDSREERRIQHA